MVQKLVLIVRQRVFPRMRPSKVFLTTFFTGLLAILNLLLIFYVLFSDGFFRMF